jgi:hypothetical protein
VAVKVESVDAEVETVETEVETVVLSKAEMASRREEGSILVVNEVVAMEETPDVHMVVGIQVVHTVALVVGIQVVHTLAGKTMEIPAVRTTCTVMEIQMAVLSEYSTILV